MKFLVFILLFFLEYVTAEINIITAYSNVTGMDNVLEDDCRLIINEINVDDPSKPEKREYIELSTNCASEKSLRGFKLLGLSANIIPTIDLVVHFWNAKISNKYFLIGGIDVQNADFSVTSDYVQFGTKYNKQTSLMNFIGNGNRNLKAIVLIYNKNHAFNEFTIKKGEPRIKITNDMKATIREYIVDMVVYGRQAQNDKCQLFEDIYPDFINRKYALREYDQENKEDLSLNHCSLDGAAFAPEKFRLGKKTPGTENDCTGRAFFLEDKILNVLPMYYDVRTDSLLDEMNYEHISGECSSSISRSDYRSISVGQVNKEIQTELTAAEHNSCTKLLLSPDSGNIRLELDSSNARKRRISDVHDYSEMPEWETDKYFRDEW